MSTAQTTSPGDKPVWTRLKRGPTATLTEATRWQWYEAVWAVSIFAWFGTTGRISEILVAASLVAVWILGPAIGVVVVGHLAVTALEVLPRIVWQLAVTELILVAPVVIELWLVTDDRRVSVQSTLIVLVFTGVATAAIQSAFSLLQVSGALAVGYGIATGWLSLHNRTTHSDTAKNRDTTETDQPVGQSRPMADEGS